MRGAKSLLPRLVQYGAVILHRKLSSVHESIEVRAGISDGHSPLPVISEILITERDEGREFRSPRRLESHFSARTRARLGARISGFSRPPVDSGNRATSLAVLRLLLGLSVTQPNMLHQGCVTQRVSEQAFGSSRGA